MCIRDRVGTDLQKLGVVVAFVVSREVDRLAGFAVGDGDLRIRNPRTRGIGDGADNGTSVDLGDGRYCLLYTSRCV